MTNRDTKLKELLLLDGLSIEATLTETEVYLTPDIDIHKNLSMNSATSSVYANTGAPIVKHLNTFSIEEEEGGESDLLNFSICSTKEEEELDVVHLMKEHTHDDDDGEMFDDDNEDTENNYLPGRFQRPHDSFGICKSVGNASNVVNQSQPQPQAKQSRPQTNKQHPQVQTKQPPMRPILSIITAIVPPTGTNTDENIPKGDVRSPRIPMCLDPRSPRAPALAELCSDSSQNVKQRIQHWENYTHQ